MKDNQWIMIDNEYDAKVGNFFVNYLTMMGKIERALNRLAIPGEDLFQACKGHKFFTMMDIITRTLHFEPGNSNHAF